MKKSKTFLFILICILVFVLSLALAACDGKEESREKTEYKVAVMSDLHYFSPELIGDYSYDSIQSKLNDAKTYEISRAMIMSALDEVVSGGYNAVIITGDLCDDHALQSHTELAEIFASVEERGVDVFVVPGNHDVDGSGTGYQGVKYTESGIEQVEDFYDTPSITESFKNIYLSFGYDKARASLGLTYVADLTDKLRLLAIDNCSTEFSLATVEFIKQQLAIAKQDGVRVIAAMHKPIYDIFDEVSMFIDTSSAVTDYADELEDALKGNVSLLLVGHNHANDAVTHSSGEDELYEIMTVSLTQSTNSYRVLEFSKNYIYGSVKKLGTIKAEYLPDYLTAADKSLILSDYSEYSKARVNRFVTARVKGIDLSSKISDIVFGESIPEGFDAVAKDIEQFVFSPFKGEGSYAEFMKSYGYDFPDNGYGDIFDLMTDIALKVFDGGENLKGTKQMQTLSAAIKAVFAYVYSTDFFDYLSDAYKVTRPDSNKVISLLLQSDKLNLLSSSLVDALLHFDAVTDILNTSSSSLVKILKAYLPKDGRFDSTEELNVFLSLIPVLELMFDVDLDKYFEEQTDGEYTSYTGVVDFDGFVSAFLFDGAVKSFVTDFDFPDRTFKISY